MRPHRFLVTSSVIGAWPGNELGGLVCASLQGRDIRHYFIEKSERASASGAFDQPCLEDQILGPRRPDQRNQSGDVRHRRPIAERSREWKADPRRSVPIRISQQAAIPAPPPVQAPAIAAMVGTRHGSKVPSTRSDPSLIIKRILRSLERLGIARCRLPDANALSPAPVRIIALIDRSLLMVSQIAAICSYIAKSERCAPAAG